MFSPHFSQELHTYPFSSENLLNTLKRTMDEYRRIPNFSIPVDTLQSFSASTGKPKLILLGTSFFATLLITELEAHAEFLAVVDDFRARRGDQFNGLDIITSEQLIALKTLHPQLITVNCCRVDYSNRYFADLTRHANIPCINFEEAMRLFENPKHADHRVADWGPDISNRFDEFLQLGNLLSDEYSKQTLYSVLLFHLTCNHEWHANISRPYSTLYFRTGLFTFSDKEKLVDCGASIGESTSALIGTTQGQFAHSWMIEPDKFNIETLQKLMRKYKNTPIEQKLSLLPYAVGESEAEVEFIHQGGHGGMIAPAGASLGESGKVHVNSIDNLIDDSPTFIKMDIEGAEMSALRGAENTIKSAHPKLAVSAYHRSTDLIDIVKFIQSLNSDYRIGLRHHTEDRWDTCLYFY
ncbi:MAG: FkbM family methyltransferase [Pseudomonadota bacterium]